MGLCDSRMEHLDPFSRAFQILLIWVRNILNEADKCAFLVNFILDINCVQDIILLNFHALLYTMSQQFREGMLHILEWAFEEDVVEELFILSDVV